VLLGRESSGIGLLRCGKYLIEIEDGDCGQACDFSRFMCGRADMGGVA
jgi:hypothetical protein